MPEKKTIRESKALKREGKAETTQAGPFVEEEIRHVRSGKHGARSTKQAIAIGLSKARESGVDLPPPKKGRASERTRESAARARKRAKKGGKPSAKRSRAAQGALKREGRAAASKKALSRQARTAAARRKRSGKATANPKRKK